MSKEIKRISVSAFENIAKQATNESTVVWEGLELNIRSQLPFDEMLAFVSEVTASCFFEDGSYAPEMMDFMIRRGVLYRYANFRLPQDINKQYWLAYATDAVEFVYNHIDTHQFQAITTAIREKVEHQCDLMVSESQQKLNALLSQFDSFAATYERKEAYIHPTVGWKLGNGTYGWKEEGRFWEGNWEEAEALLDSLQAIPSGREE